MYTCLFACHDPPISSCWEQLNPGLLSQRFHTCNPEPAEESIRTFLETTSQGVEFRQLRACVLLTMHCDYHLETLKTLVVWPRCTP
jgi:hypothetical protein